MSASHWETKNSILLSSPSSSLSTASLSFSRSPARRPHRAPPCCLVASHAPPLGSSHGAPCHAPVAVVPARSPASDPSAGFSDGAASGAVGACGCSGVMGGRGARRSWRRCHRSPRMSRVSIISIERARATHKYITGENPLSQDTQFNMMCHITGPCGVSSGIASWHSELCVDAELSKCSITILLYNFISNETCQYKMWEVIEETSPERMQRTELSGGGGNTGAAPSTSQVSTATGESII